ncbi:MAG: hypothetical protein BGO70_05590 [Bacteroidetes bacterium 43-93]|nr:MAG: hypothetical protein BGO70_05590 [Bacteroidetes bacterium 43-93]
MIIGVAGPYSAPTEEQKQANLDALNQAAAVLLAKGHTPLIGVNAALPVVNAMPVADHYEAIMKISMAVMHSCEALLVIADSPGANRERELFESKRLPVYRSIDEVPDISA